MACRYRETLRFTCRSQALLAFGSFFLESHLEPQQMFMIILLSSFFGDDWFGGLEAGEPQSEVPACPQADQVGGGEKVLPYFLVGLEVEITE
jgi:hypothetical protein